MNALPQEDPTLSLPRVYSDTPPLMGSIKAEPEDFVVVEQLGYRPSGDGEHVFITLRKRERNTSEVANMLAKFAGVKRVAIGYAGLKDKHAVTEQSFTVQLPGKESPNWSNLEDDYITILNAERHNRKIRRGSLLGNAFRIRIRNVAGDRGLAEQILESISNHGVPNYFGSQRFGREGNNLQMAEKVLIDGQRFKRDKLSIYLSAARSYLFNLVVAERISQGHWGAPMDGDVMQLSGSNKHFHVAQVNDDIQVRHQSLDIHATGALYGKPSRALEPTGYMSDIEQAIAEQWRAWIAGIERIGVEADRRAMRIPVAGMNWFWQQDSLVLNFSLPSGCYATSVLRELI